jgi:Mn2+/Fe2+ NRAMP family transporter
MKSQRGFLRSIGPAMIVAAVVLGPGSILSNSKVGWQHGYDMVWVVVLAGVLLVGLTTVSARLGALMSGTICEELARRIGRPVAIAVGVALFLVAAGFQFGNNLGVLYAIEPFLEGSGSSAAWLSASVLIVLNGVLIVALLRFRKLYAPVEAFVKVLVGVMLLGFAFNLLLAKPSIVETLRGLVPTFPSEDQGGVMTLLALVATTCSVGAAFYHSYLVRQKGWTTDDLGRGLVDSVIGIGTLILMSLMIMVTAAAVLHGNDDVKELKSAADVADQLRPLFGPFATAVFCTGIFAGALSSFLVNAMIGGTVLSDGLGLGGSMDGRWPKRFTILALVIGMVVAIAVKTVDDFDTGGLIIFAQAVTVLMNPLLAGSLAYLAFVYRLPIWMRIASLVGLVTMIALAWRTVLLIVDKLSV